MFLGCSKDLFLLCRPVSRRTSQTLRPPGGKSARLKYRPLEGSHGYKNLTNFTPVPPARRPPGTPQAQALALVLG